MFIRIAGISAVLAALSVVVLEVPSAQSRTPVKIYNDRAPVEASAPAGIRTASAEAPEVARPQIAPAVARPAGQSCRGTWPYVDADCMGTERRPVRTITIERRDAPNTSNLVRIPVATH